MGLGMSFSILCWSGAVVIGYMYIAPSLNKYSTVTDLKKKAKSHNKKHYSEPNKRGGF